MTDLLIKFRASIILFFDLAIGFISLALMLLTRYKVTEFKSQFSIHLFPFIIVIMVIIFCLYIFNLYSARFNRSITEFNDSFIKSVLLSFFISITIFYIFGSFFDLTPKTNLVIFTGFFGLIDFSVRILIRRQYSKRNINRKIVLVGVAGNLLLDEIKRNETIGYKILKEEDKFNYDEIIKIKPDILVVEEINEEIFGKLYSLIKAGISVYTANLFYEETFRKIPTETLNKNDIVKYVGGSRSVFIVLKRFMDLVTSFSFLIILSPIFVLVAIAVRVTSSGPILIRQKRIGKNDQEFILLKFRSMYKDSEKDGAVWTKDDKTDKRITPLGRILRKTHLDEMPQLINIFRGEISLVGPRPERPEFTQMLEKEIPYYDLRHSVKPGLTGWAQVNYRYGSSIDDTKEKLKFDFYYIKNRNIFLDILILIKTLAMVLTKH